MKTKTALKLCVCVLKNDFCKHLNKLKPNNNTDALFVLNTNTGILINIKVLKSAISKSTYYKNLVHSILLNGFKIKFS
ncbi:MAG: hypothetical protein ABJM36_00215 [Algibacter sp.]|uniref:hypothetical protein n=1 Tax=Algibacter sp. TaxID=1872428 RepID=UPI00329A6B3A